MAASTEACSTSDASNQFLINLCQLAILVDKCLVIKFSTTASEQTKQQVFAELMNFPTTSSSDQPQTDGSLGVCHGYYPAILRLMHLDYLVVIHRMLSPNLSTNASDDMDTPFKSAGIISRILEDLLCSSSDLITRLPFLSFPAIFCSILIHIIYIRKGPGNIQVLAEHRAHLAMVVLDQLQDRWPIVVWTRYLLNVLLKETESTKLPSTEIDQHPQLTQTGGERQSPSLETSDPVPMVGSRTASQQNLYSVAGSVKEPNFTPGLHEGTLNPRTDQLRVNSAAADLSFSPIPLMFPLNSFLEDTGMDFEPWLLGLGLDE